MGVQTGHLGRGVCLEGANYGELGDHQEQEQGTFLYNVIFGGLLPTDPKHELGCRDCDQFSPQLDESQAPLPRESIDSHRNKLELSGLQSTNS